MAFKANRLLLTVVACFLLAIAIVFLMDNYDAKRKHPLLVPPVRIAGVEYRVPNGIESQGVVEAWDINTGRLLWTKKVYRTYTIPFLESDTQWVFIKSLTVGPATNTLIVINERGQKYMVKTSPPSSATAVWLSVLGLLLCTFTILIIRIRRNLTIQPMDNG